MVVTSGEHLPPPAQGGPWETARLGLPPPHLDPGAWAARLRWGLPGDRQAWAFTSQLTSICFLPTALWTTGAQS